MVGQHFSCRQIVRLRKPFGVPQDSDLGPIPFCLFIPALPQSHNPSKPLVLAVEDMTWNSFLQIRLFFDCRPNFDSFGVLSPCTSFILKIAPLLSSAAFGWGPLHIDIPLITLLQVCFLPLDLKPFFAPSYSDSRRWGFCLVMNWSLPAQMWRPFVFVFRGANGHALHCSSQLDITS